MSALASKRWDRGDAQESSRTATHTQLSTAHGPSGIAATVHPDDLLPAQQEDSSCSDVSPANVGVRQCAVGVQFTVQCFKIISSIQCTTWTK